MEMFGGFAQVTSPVLESAITKHTLKRGKIEGEGVVFLFKNYQIVGWYEPKAGYPGQYYLNPILLINID